MVEEKDEVLGLTKLFHENRHTTIPADVRRKLNIFKNGSYKLLWRYDPINKHIYINMSKEDVGSYDATPYRGT